MALLTCPDCAGPVSDLAPSCPHCGRPAVLPPTGPKLWRLSSATIRGSVFVALLVTSVVGFLAVRRAHALGVPTLTPLTYSGTLLTYGSPDTATHNMSLSLFLAGSGSAACTTDATVTCVNGRFTIPLSSECVAIVQQNPDVQVEITVDNTPLGRSSVSAVPYALEAGAVASAATVGTTAPANPTTGMLFFNTSNGTLQVFDGTLWNSIVLPNTTVPPGVVAWYAAPTCPAGWLEANGATLDSATYSALYAAIGTTFGGTAGNFQLPQLDGEFIRGWDHGRGADSGRGFGTFEWGSSIAFDAYFANSAAFATATGYQDRMGWNNQFDEGFQPNVALGTNLNGVTVPPGGSGSNASYGVATPTAGSINGYDMFVGTRPRNVALLPCIKF